MKNNNVISLPQIMLSLLIQDLHEKIQILQRKASEDTAKALLKALEVKDDYTYGHSMRVAYYSVCLGKELNLAQEEIKCLELSALFHDIGKIGTPEQVLNKPTRLDEEEFLVMKEHPELTGKILGELDGFKEIAKFAMYHHERYDGRGYPHQLKEEEIPLYSRIILIADTFDAMTSSRPYRKGLDYEIAFQELRDFAGTQFDPNLVEHFITAMKKEQSKNEDEFYIEIVDDNFKKDAA